MGNIRGGLEFPQGRPIRLPPPPEQLPAERLRIHCPERPEVIAGQTVRRGQHLLQPLHESEPCHICPVTGTVRDVRAEPAGGYGLVIDPPGRTVITSLEVSAPRGRRLEGWLNEMRQVGPWPDTEGGVGLIGQLDAARNHEVDTLVCVGMDRFPPFPDRSSLLLSFPDDAVLGTLILADLLNVKRVVMRVGRVPAMLGRLRASCKRFRLRLSVVNNRYPAAQATMVAHGPRPAGGRARLLPHGHNPVTQGLVLITPWTAIRIGRWFTLRRLDLLQPVFIGQMDGEEPLSGHYAMPGQPLASLAPRLFEVHGAEEETAGDPAAAGAETGPAPPAPGGNGEGPTVLAGDPLTGRAIGGPRTVPADRSLVSLLPPHRKPAPEPCIQCGWCLDVCPTRLDPVRMYHAARRRHDDGWLADQLPWCIECGLCSYVCPSALPLAQTLGESHQRMEPGE